MEVRTFVGIKNNKVKKNKQINTMNFKIQTRDTGTFAGIKILSYILLNQATEVQEYMCMLLGSENFQRYLSANGMCLVPIKLATNLTQEMKSNIVVSGDVSQPLCQNDQQLKFGGLDSSDRSVLISVVIVCQKIVVIKFLC